MAGTRDFIKLDGSRYQVDPKGIRRGPAPPLVPRFSVGDQAFTGGIPPLQAKGQRQWDGGFQVKYFQAQDHRGFRSSVDVDMEHRDRIILAKSFSGTIYNTSQNNVKIVQVPFQDCLFAYSTASNNVWFKDATNAWAAVTLPGAWTGTTPTGWLSDTIAPNGTGSSTAILLQLGSDKGHVMSISTSGAIGSKSATGTEVGRPSNGSANLQGGIYAMTAYRSALFLGGADSSGKAILGTYDGTTFTKLGGDDLMTGARVGILHARHNPAAQTPDELHFVVIRTSANTGDMAAHWLYNGTTTSLLRTWLDNYPLCATEYDVAGAKGIVFGMAKLGIVWRYAGDYTELLRLDTPDEAYTGGIPAIVQFGRFIICPKKDTTNGLSLLWYDGLGWWQDSATGSSYTGDASGLGVYRNTLFLVHAASGAARIFERNTGSNYPSTGHVVTSLIDGDYRQTPKRWIRCNVQHSPLAASETIKVEYALDDSASGSGGSLSGAYSEDFSTAGYRDTTNTTAVWDTTNRKLTIQGAAAKTLVAAGTTHKAYHAARATPTSDTPSSFIAAATEFTTGAGNQYDYASADDANATATGSTVASAGTLDQSATTEDDGKSMSTANWRGQIVQAGASGLLDQAITKLSMSSGSATVEARLYAVTGSGASRLPTGSPLATSGAQTISGAAAEYTFQFASPATVVSGTSYALVFVQTGGTGSGLRVRYSTSSSYANGFAVTSPDSGASWNSNSGEDLYFKTYVGGTASTTGYACQLFSFDLSGITLNTIPLTYIGFGADTTGSANKGVTLYVWNAMLNAWESKGSNTAGSGDSDAAKTITATISSNPSHYQDTNGKINVLLVSSYAGTAALASRVTTDFVRMDASFTTSLKTGRSVEVDSISSGNIPTATLTVTSSGSGTVTPYMSVDNGTTWESVTSGVEKTFATSGNQLKWRIDLTAASASDDLQVTAVTISYAQPGSGSAQGWVTMGTNSTDGTDETEFYFDDGVHSRLLNFRFTLGSGGTTTPQLHGFSVEFYVSPDVREAFYCTLVLEDDYDYSDGTTETRSAQTQYDTLLALEIAKRTPSFEWVNGQAKQQVSFLVGHFTGDETTVPAEEEEERRIMVPIQLVTVRD